MAQNDTKHQFKLKFPYIDLDDKDVITYINSKYREAKNINQGKFKNTDKIFILKDESNNIISHVIDYYEDEQ